MRWVVLPLLLAGCFFKPDAPSGGGIGSDADVTGVDLGLDTPALMCTEWIAEHFDPCLIPLNTKDDVTLLASSSPYTFDTAGAGTLRDISGNTVMITSVDYTQLGGTHVAIWALHNLTVETAADLHVVGPKPLVIAAWSAIDVAGKIDAGSYISRTGAGANPGACAVQGAQTGEDGIIGSGGGGGGGFGGQGGSGSTGDGGCLMPPGCYASGGPGGGALVNPPTIVRGGCSGAPSGTSSSMIARGGAGGGAVLLAARTTITITGRVRAGGAGGDGDSSGIAATGGGGGGSGGFIGLEAQTIDVTGAILAANGGGGGAGADGANEGTRGEDGPGNVGPAGGGISNGGGANGGDGSQGSFLAGATPPESTPPPSGGGGGGGGGAGFILYWTSNWVAPSGTRAPPALPGT